MSGPSVEEAQPGRNRKRYLEPCEDHDEEVVTRKQAIFNDWPEAFSLIRNPAKKGYQTTEKDFTDSINLGLANNFDDSLNCLGLDEGGTYDMSEQISALSHLGIMKEEAASPQKTNASTPVNVFDENAQSNTSDRILRILNMDPLSAESSSTSSIYQFLQQQVYSDNYANANSGKTSPESFSPIDEVQKNGASNSTQECFAKDSEFGEHRFQYILGAATSVATKVNEESLTYLNQGQPYEIKVKKLGDITKCQGKLYHTKVRICFHERRLQYMEKEHLEGWKQLRPGERIAEIDVPLSYGAMDITHTPKLMNCCEFDWDPSKEVGVYIKVNCVSTEFTPKKHGGEKGVPFRIQVETYAKGDNSMKPLHVCACQIKVFKLKGAERKHKQDKEKIQKRFLNGKDRYQDQCDCTILQEISVDTMHIPSHEVDDSESPNPADKVLERPYLATNASATSLDEIGGKDELRESQSLKAAPTASTNVADTAAWLLSNRFNKYLSVFTSFSGADLLRLSRAELREICGLADGIRLYNALHDRVIPAKRTLYVCLDTEHVYNACYLDNLTCSELVDKMCYILCIPIGKCYEVYLRGPHGIDIVFTDQVLANLPDETLLGLNVWKDDCSDRYRLFFRLLPTPNSTS